MPHNPHDPLDPLLPDSTVLAVLGGRLARHRLERNWTQAELALRAGVGQATVQRVERGESVQMTSMIKLLRALELLDGLDAAIPRSVELPIAQLEREQRERRATRHRARPRTARADRPAAATTAERWTWGEEAEAVGERPGEAEAADERPGASE